MRSFTKIKAWGLFDKEDKFIWSFASKKEAQENKDEGEIIKPVMIVF